MSEEESSALVDGKRGRESAYAVGSSGRETSVADTADLLVTL